MFAYHVPIKLFVYKYETWGQGCARRSGPTCSSRTTSSSRHIPRSISYHLLITSLSNSYHFPITFISSSYHFLITFQSTSYHFGLFAPCVPRPPPGVSPDPLTRRLEACHFPARILSKIVSISCSYQGRVLKLSFVILSGRVFVINARVQ